MLLELKIVHAQYNVDELIRPDQLVVIEDVSLSAVHIGRILVKLVDNTVFVNVINTTNDEVIIYPNTTLGKIEIPDQILMIDEKFDIRNVTNKFPQVLEPLVAGAEIDEAAKVKLRKLLMNYASVFSINGELGVTNLHKHTLNTKDNLPIVQRPYKISRKEDELIKENIDKMLNDGVISHSKCPWSSSIVLIKKKDGTVRFRIDYRKLNAVTMRDQYPLSIINEVLDSLSGAWYFSTLDAQSSY